MLVINVSHPPYYYPTKLDGEKKIMPERSEGNINFD
jgi:hypothetical protein